MPPLNVDFSTLSRIYFYDAETSHNLYGRRMMDEWYARLTEAINRALERSDRSYADFERRTGKNRNMMRDIAKGHVPKVDSFLIVCDYIEADPIEILSGNSRGGLSTKIVQAARHLDPKHQEQLLAILETFPTQDSTKQ